MLLSLCLRRTRRGLQIGLSLAGGRSVADATTGQFHFNRVSYHGFDHRLVPVVATPAPCRLGLLIAIAYHGAAARPLSSEEFDVDDITFPLEFAHSGKPVPHILEKGVNVGICAQPCPRQKQVASQFASCFYKLLSRLIIEVGLKHAFEDLGSEEARKELPLTPFLFGHSVRQLLAHCFTSLGLCAPPTQSNQINCYLTEASRKLMRADCWLLCRQYRNITLLRYFQVTSVHNFGLASRGLRSRGWEWLKNL